MSSLKTIRKVLFKARDNAKAILAVSATLIFGAGLISLMQISLTGGDYGVVLAGVNDGSFVNICGTNPPSGNWGQHNANPACQGCEQSGSCSGNHVWVYSCKDGEQYSDIECRANGVSYGTSANFDAVFADDCKMYQIDVFENGQGVGLTDFVVWKGNRFGSPSCNPQIPASCQSISGPSGTINPYDYPGGMSYSGSINSGEPEVLQWYLDESAIPGATSSNVTIDTPASGTHTVRLSVNEDNVGACSKTFIVKESVQPNISCDSKTANPSASRSLRSGDSLTYYIDYTAENVEVPGATIIDVLPNGFTLDTLPSNCDSLSPIIACKASESGKITLEGHVDNDYTGTELANSARVEYPGSTTSYCNTVTHTIIHPSVECISKSVTTTNPAEGKEISVEVGDELVYTINYTSSNVEGKVKIVDYIDDHLEFVSFTGLKDCSYDNTITNPNDPDYRRLICNVEPNSKASIVYTTRVISAGTIPNTAIVSANGQSDTCHVDIEASNPKVKCIEKTNDAEDPNNVRIGDSLVYTIRYTSSDLNEQMKIIDYIDEGFEFEGVVGLENCSYNSTITDPDDPAYRRFTCDVGPNTEGMVRYAVKVLREGVIPNTTIVSAEGHQDICKADINVKTPIVNCIEKKAEHEYPSDIKVGDTVMYTISYSSLNQPEGELVTISDLLDVNLGFVGFENGAGNYCTYNNDTREIICSVQGNQTGELSYSAVIINDGTITNQAVVTDNYGHSESKGCKVDFDARPLREELICVSKEADNNYMNYGDEGDFVITYQNTGETELDGITLHDTLPVGMEFVSAEDDMCRVLTPEELAQYGPAVYDSNRDTVRCESPNVLRPREKATFRFTIKIRDDAPAGDSVVNEVSSLLSEEVQGDVSACTEEVFINLPKPSVIVEKETKSPADRTMVLGDDAETPEDNVRFLITVTNNGPTKLVKVPLYDKFYADDYEFVSANPSPDTDEYIPAARPLVKLFWNDLGELNPGESTVVEVVLRALETHSADKLINYTKVEDAVDENGILLDSNIDDDYVIIEGSILGEQLNFNIVKTLVTENPTKEGEVVKFHIVITNTGTKTIEKIKLVDDYDTNYLEFTDFSAKISHDSSLYSVNAEDGVFTHLNILSALDFLEPGEEMDMDIWFLAKNKKGETINLAEATIDDLVDFDTAKVTIVVEELADTGSNILAILAIGVALSCFGVVGVNYLKKKR